MVTVTSDDISYIPTVIFIAYLGSRGNRAKWIGAGTVVIAISYLMIASPNFIFPVPRPSLNTTIIEAELKVDNKLLSEDVQVKDYFNYAPLRDRLPMKLRDRVTEFLENSVQKRENAPGEVHRNNSESLYSIDEPLIAEVSKNRYLLIDFR